MILSIESSLPTFKPVRFGAGLNVLLADSDPSSTAKQTRNSAGKTSLVEIIHFIFGADCDKDSLFRSPHLIDYSFTGTFSLGAVRMVVERSGKDHSKIFILEGAENGAALPVREDKESGRIYISNTNWRAFLGHKMFGLADLYEDRFGRFVIEATDNGPEFKISIEGDRGGGIANMEIFCFDLALLLLVSKRLGGPGFLIHDSHLFDGVDERQIAKALSLGARAATGNDLQYIVTMNSDIFDRLPLSDDVDRETIVVKTRLSDLTEVGGLFGFRFE